MSVATSPLGLLMGTQVLVVGLGENELPWGLLKVYINARYRGEYVIVDQCHADEFRSAWAGSFGGHLLTDKPDPEKVFRDSDGGPELAGWSLSSAVEDGEDSQ